MLTDSELFPESCLRSEAFVKRATSHSSEGLEDAALSALVQLLESGWRAACAKGVHEEQ